MKKNHKMTSLWLILMILFLCNNGMSEPIKQSKIEASRSLPPISSKLGASPEDRELPVFPENENAVYFVVAVTGGAKAWGRTLARTLLELPFSNGQGPPLRPIYVDLPQNGRFSVKILTTLCDQIENVPVVGMIVLGDGQSARSMALSGNAMKIPVLWAKGGIANLNSGGNEDVNYLQAVLQPSAKEILEAVRAIFLQTHWHSFFVLSDVSSTIILGSNTGKILKESPLSPTILPLSTNKDDVFRQLAKISRSTRGIVLLLCDLGSARRVLAEAQRLNMCSGHFVWIWADTSSTAEFFQPHSVYNEKETILNAKENYKSHMKEFMDRKIKYEKNDPYYRESRRNKTRYNTPNMNRFHQIIGLHNLNDNLEESIESVIGTSKNYLKTDKLRDFAVNTKEKRDSVSNSKSKNGVNEANKNSFDYNENEYKSSVESLNMQQNVLGGHNHDSNESEKNYYDSFAIESVDNEQDKNGKIKNGAKSYDEDDYIEQVDRLSSTKRPQMSPLFMAEKLTEVEASKFVAEPIDDDSEENESSETLSENNADLKSKRAHFHANDFNKSSTVLFHNFRDFPIGLLALKPTKMNVDRYFIRSSVRLFAGAWTRAERDEEQRYLRYMNRNRGKSSINWEEMYQESDAVTNNRKDNSLDINTRRINNRNRKIKREATASDNEIKVLSKINGTSSFKLLNDSLENVNINSGLKVNQYEIKSNNSSFRKNASSSIKLNDNIEILQNISHSNASIAVQKRQNTWWSNTDAARSRVQPVKTKNRGTPQYRGGCFGTPNRGDIKRAEIFSRYLQHATALSLSGRNLPDGIIEKPLISNFEILNLVPTTQEYYRKSPENDQNDLKSSGGTKWRRVGFVSGSKVPSSVQLDTIIWPGGDIFVSGLSSKARSVFRIVTSLSPPFVFESDVDDDGLCLRGLVCRRLTVSGKHNLTLLFNSIETKGRLKENLGSRRRSESVREEHNEKLAYKSKCCYGLAMDLLISVASELGFEFHLYIARDELFGSRSLSKKINFNHQTLSKEYSKHGEQNYEKNYEKNYENSREKSRGSSSEYYYDANNKEKDYRSDDRDVIGRKNSKYYVWDGIIGDLVSGSADMSFAPLSVSKARAEVVDFSIPYFHSGVSLVAAPKTKYDIPLLAFLLPFSPELWIAIFTTLNITAVAVAIYEWLSPFGLNPWGRQRTKNFSLSSSLWVMWSLLCGHLVAFKAPKSWPNKLVINIFGGFSVIFVASYTANIAALIAGLFFQNAVSQQYDGSLLSQRVGTPRSSAAESYIQRNDKQLWDHIKKFSMKSIEEGIVGLKNGSIDLLMADTPILNYYQGSDQGCSLRKIGDNYIEDVYAIGMKKGFPLRESISALISKYSSNGYLDILTEKWYGGLPCYKSESDIQIIQPRPLGVSSVAGVFLLLGLGMVLGIIILIFEHWFFKYSLPILRQQPKGTIWRSRNIMFFSQKLYRFINCVELVSPHHAARELVHTLRQGHITSLFQKSVKRKEDEQRRRRKSKAQFFEMIQEIRRVQQLEKDQPIPSKIPVVTVVENSDKHYTESEKPPIKPKPSPKLKLFSSKKDQERSSSNASSLNVRRFSTDNLLGERLDTIGRRLSREIINSPPDLGHRFETFGKNSVNKFDTFNTFSSNYAEIHKSADDIERSKYDTIGGTIDELKPELPIKQKNIKNKQKRKPLNMDVYEKKNEKVTFENQCTLPIRDSIRDRESIRESWRESLHPPIFQLDRSKVVLRDRLHEELKAKYGNTIKISHSTKSPRTVKRPNSSENYLKVQSNDSLNTRPTPTPRQTKFESEEDDEDMDPTYATILPKVSPRTKSIPLGKLSKDDLLKLSQSTESEIHDFLNGSSGKKMSDQP